MITISDAEFKVMQVIWNKKRTTSNEIIKEVAENNWSSNTVRTLINRLVLKKAVGIVEKNGKTYTYIPLIEEKKYRNYETMKFIKQLFNGSVKEFILFLAENDSEYRKQIQKFLKEI